MTATLDHPTRPVSARTEVQPVTLWRTVAAAWNDFRSLRSTRWTVAAYIAVLVGMSLLVSWATVIEQVDDGAGSASIAQYLSAGYQLARLVVAVLGVMLITGEYSSGQIRTTLTAVPRRWMVLASKAIVLAGVVLVATVVSMALSYVVTMPFHDDLNIDVDVTQGETARMLIGLPLYLAAIGVFALAMGALVRHTAGALALIIGLLLVIENVVALVPFDAFDYVRPFLPASAGAKVLYDSDTLSAFEAMGEAVTLSPWQGFAVLMAWVAALGAAATIALHKRDA